MTYDLLRAHGMLPLKDCAKCAYKQSGDGWCYMFKDEPKSDYCGQFDAKPLRLTDILNRPK